MLINGIDVPQYQLSYDKILKNTLAQSDELTVRFINGLFGDSIPLDATVTWLDKESVSDEYKAFVADFYPKIDDQMYAIEVEQDDRGNMALRIFKYAVGGAIHHNMTATDDELNIVFPQPCVIFLNSTKNTPKGLVWRIEFFDGQKVTLQVPTIRLAELTANEIARRDLFPIGQFYLRTFDSLNKHNIDTFREAAASLLTNLYDAAQRGVIPWSIGLQMQETIRKTAANAVSKSEQEVDFTMDANILETLPWINYDELFRKLEERGKVEGRSEGRAERDLEIALNLFARQKQGANKTALTQTLKDLGISEETIEVARKQAGHAEKKPRGQER